MVAFFKPGNPGNPGTTLLMAPPSLPSAPPGLTSLALVNKILIDRKDDMCKGECLTCTRHRWRCDLYRLRLKLIIIIINRLFFIDCQLMNYYSLFINWPIIYYYLQIN